MNGRWRSAVKRQVNILLSTEAANVFLT